MGKHDKAGKSTDRQSGIKRHWKLLLAAELVTALVLVAAIVLIYLDKIPGRSGTDPKPGTTAEQSGADSASGSAAAGSGTDDSEQADNTSGIIKRAESAIEDAAKKGSAKPAGQFSVFIETGHGIDSEGKWDPGCSWSDGTTTYEEAKVMIPIARSMVKYLRRSGIDVHTDADDGNQQNLFAALDYMETHQMDAFVNLHCDAPGTGSGTMPLYRTEEQKALGIALNNGVHEYIDIADRGLQYREDLDTLNSDKPKCPACLFETGSISSDNELLTKHYDEYGKALAKGLCDYLGVEFIESE